MAYGKSRTSLRVHYRVTPAHPGGSSRKSSRPPSILSSILQTALYLERLSDGYQPIIRRLGAHVKSYIFAFPLRISTSDLTASLRHM